MNANSSPFVIHGYGDAAPWLDLVNSEHWDGFGNFTEMLDKPEWLSSFVEFWGFRVPPVEPFPQEELRTLRALIRELVEKAANGKKLSLEQLAPLNDWMSVPLTPKLEEDQSGIRIRLEIVQSGWHATLGNITYSFAQSLIEHGQSRLRICQNNDCRWIFIDKTKGNVRRWCNTATCGNRERVRKARAAEKH
jgi:predicted RNA-binding Zn ribbon-like protein